MIHDLLDAGAVVLALAMAAMLFIGLMSALDEMNPDPGRRRREAEIIRLEQERRLKELREP